MTLGYVKRDTLHICRYLRYFIRVDRHICRYLRVFSYMVTTFVVIYVILAPLLRDTSHFVHRRVILDYVKRDARDFCRYLRDSRLRKKRQSPHLSLFTILYHMLAELIATFVVIYESLATWCPLSSLFT